MNSEEKFAVFEKKYYLIIQVHEIKSINIDQSLSIDSTQTKDKNKPKHHLKIKLMIYFRQNELLKR